MLEFRRSTYRYRSIADGQAALRIRLRDLAYSRVSYGYRRLHVLLRREGCEVNHKRVYRLYKLEGLMMRPKKAQAACHRLPADGEDGGYRTKRGLEHGFYE